MIRLIEENNIQVGIEVKDYIPTYAPDRPSESVITKLIAINIDTKEIIYNNNDMFCNYDYILIVAEDILYLVKNILNDKLYNKYRDCITNSNTLVLDQLTHTDCLYEIGLKRIKNAIKEDFYNKEILRIKEENKQLEEDINSIATNKQYLVYYNGVEYYIVKIIEIDSIKINNDTLKIIMEEDRYNKKYFNRLEYKIFKQDDYNNLGKISLSIDSFNFMLKDALEYLKSL